MSESLAPRIVVVGSLNMDLVLRVAKLPRPGETVTSESFRTVPGGKGANQALALARLGAQVALVGRVGDDDYGVELRNRLSAERVDVARVRVTPGISSGVAVIQVADSGENSIAIVAGANGQLTPADVESDAELIREADMLVIQNETPLPTVVATVVLAKRLGTPVIYDPAPALREPLPDELWSVDVLSPNQSEAEALAGRTIRSTQDAIAAAQLFRSRGAKQVVLKLGEQGALAIDSNDVVTEVRALPVEAVDTTAAGDAFTAALAWRLCSGQTLLESVRWACAAGALAVTRHGAQPSLPTAGEVEQLIATHHGHSSGLRRL